jgi:hypothetical protein
MVTSKDWEIPVRAHPRQSGGPYMHFRKALIVKMSNLRPLHHKDTIDLFKIGKVLKTNKMVLCKMGNFIFFKCSVALQRNDYTL